MKIVYLLSYMLKPPPFLTQKFKENKEAQAKILKHMCDFGSQSVWRSVRRYVRYCIHFDTRKGQDYLLNPNYLDCITGYLMYGSVGDRPLKNLPHRRLETIYCSISGYCCILN